MRILLTTPSMQAGGAERVVTMLAAELATRGHHVALAAPRGVRDADLRDVPHVRVALDDHGRARTGAARSALRVARAIQSFSPDVIHAQNVKSTVTARTGAFVAGPWRGRPVLATFHGVLPGEYRRSARLLRGAAHVACVSQDLLDGIVAAGLPTRRASLLHNAVAAAAPLDASRRAELDRELGTAGAPVVAIVGRLVPQKAHERFVVGVRRVAGELPTTRFLIVGDGPRRGAIERDVAAAGLEDRVRFTGVRSDAREIIARADVVAFSSEWEGRSIVALEALAAGTPVVSTDIQGMRELLACGGGAIVALDDGTALGERIVELLRDDTQRRAMGEAGRELIERSFSLERMIDAYERLYARLTHGR
jgi:glycosyltransferase involved in cell wall biosynthesis